MRSTTYARTVSETAIEQLIVTAINKTLSGKDTYLIVLENNLATVLSKGNEKAISEIDRRLKGIQTMIVKQASSKADCDELGEEVFRLREEKQRLQLEGAGRDELRNRMTEMSTFLREQPVEIMEFSEQLVRRLIEKVTVYEDEFTLEFKSGVTVDVNE